MSLPTTLSPRADPGAPAPLFSSVDHDQKPFHLESHLGNSWILLWFYPQAPIKGGCAKGAKGSQCGALFRRYAHFLLESKRCRVVGVNYDDPWTNWLWGGAEDHLPFYLLSDEDRSIAELYGAKRSEEEGWADLPRRMAFLIDPQGVIRRRWNVMHAAEFIDDVAWALAELQPELGVEATPPVVPLPWTIRLRVAWLRLRGKA